MSFNVEVKPCCLSVVLLCHLWNDSGKEQPRIHHNRTQFL